MNKIYRKSIDDKGENILGVDLGEYGFGWAILDQQKAKEEAEKGADSWDWNRAIIQCGFQEIPLLKQMRTAAAGWKDTQSRGIFSRPTTYLAEIREQAAGQTRNQIHRLALQYHAKPIYEDSVDGFESGGSRIEKLYKTLKTADVISGNSNEADKTVRKRFWGIEYAQMGGVIGAAKTSQTCRACGRCKTSEIEEEIRNASKNEVITLKEELAIRKKSQRQQNPEKKERGYDALFICQICHNRTDADEQAAKNIALKYFFKTKLATEDDLKNPMYRNDKGQFLSLKFFLEKSKQNVQSAP